MDKKALVVLSGGQDSTTCLFWALNQGYYVETITFNYGQRHGVEIESAKKIADLAGVKNVVVDLSGVLIGTSPLISSNVLEEYSDHDMLPSGLEKTYVPCRNQLFITVASNYAYSVGCTAIVYGNCQDDKENYPDCTDEFISAVELALNLGTFVDRSISILTPLSGLTKKDVVLLAAKIPGCLAALAYSHTAYNGVYPPLCKDHASLLRAKGFEEAGIPDPLILRAVSEGLMDLPTTVNYEGQTCINQLKHMDMTSA